MITEDTIEAVLRDAFAEGVKVGAVAQSKAIAKLLRLEKGRYHGMAGPDTACSIAKSLEQGAEVAAEQLKGIGATGDIPDDAPSP